MTTADVAPAVGPTISEVMSRPVLTIEDSESLWDAWQLLFVSGLRHLVVLDADGRTIGVLTDRSILADLPATQEHLSERRVSDVLARVPAHSVTPHQSPIAAAHLMTDRSIEALPVLDDTGRLVGILTETDIVRWVAR